MVESWVKSNKDFRSITRAIPIRIKKRKLQDVASRWQDVRLRRWEWHSTTSHVTSLGTRNLYFKWNQVPCSGARTFLRVNERVRTTLYQDPCFVWFPVLFCLICVPLVLLPVFSKLLIGFPVSRFPVPHFVFLSQIDFVAPMWKLPSAVFPDCLLHKLVFSTLDFCLFPVCFVCLIPACLCAWPLPPVVLRTCTPSSLASGSTHTSPCCTYQVYVIHNNV